MIDKHDLYNRIPHRPGIPCRRWIAGAASSLKVTKQLTGLPGKPRKTQFELKPLRKMLEKSLRQPRKSI